MSLDLLNRYVLNTAQSYFTNTFLNVIYIEILFFIQKPELKKSYKVNIFIHSLVL